MSHCEAPVVNKIKICDGDMRKIKEILNSDPRSPVVAFTFDKFGNINFFTSENEFDKSPFDLRSQQFKSIVSAAFIVTEGTHSVTVNIAGESTTSSMPF